MYNWYSTTTNKQNFTEYVPMLWVIDYEHTRAWNDDAASWIAAGSKHLLAFNESENVGQSNISPTAAADAYHQYMEPFASRAQLGGPGVSIDGRDWMKQFLSLCSDCTIDFIPIHWVRRFHELFNLSRLESCFACPKRDGGIARVPLYLVRSLTLCSWLFAFSTLGYLILSVLSTIHARFCTTS